MTSTGDEPKRSVATRASDAVARGKDRAQQLRAEVEARRPRSAAIDVAWRSVERDAEVGGGILAGAVAFRVFLFLVPFVFFLVVAFGLAAEVGNQSPRELASDAGIAGLVAASINAAGDQSLWGRITILAVSGFAMVLAARTLVKVLNVVHVLVWHLPRTRLRGQVKAVGGLVFSVALGLVLAQAASSLRSVWIPAWFFGELAVAAGAFGIWLLASMRLFPHPVEASWRDLVPGALLVAVGIEALHYVTLLFIARQFERRSETYGAIGGSLSLLLWAYVVGRILTSAVVLNAEVFRRSHPMGLPMPPPRHGGPPPDGPPPPATAPAPPPMTWLPPPSPAPLPLPPPVDGEP